MAPIPGSSICAECRYYRPPVRVELFMPEDLMNEGVMQVADELAQFHRKRTQDEALLIQQKRLFDHRPREYAWCEKFSKAVNTFLDRRALSRFEQQLGSAEGSQAATRAMAVLDEEHERLSALVENDRLIDEERRKRERRHQVTGEPTQVYVIAQYMNPDQSCARFKPAENVLASTREI